jgi:SulP family sulfate permease
MQSAAHRSEYQWLLRLLPFLSWLPRLDRDGLRTDIVAGITAGVLILPQAIALATVAGLPPQYGLYTAIFPVIIVSLWGSSWHSLSGPNTAISVLIAATIAPFANIGTPDYIQYAITLTFMTGALQLILGMLRMGNLFVYFSHTVMVALVAGVGIIIVVQQAGSFMGVVMNGHEDFHDQLRQLFYLLPQANPYAVTTGLVTLLVGLGIKRWRPSWPHYILAVLAGMLTAQILDALLGSATTRIDMVGYMEMSLLPLSAPDFSAQGFAEFAAVAYPATVSMAVLALMQSAVIARSLAVKSGQQDIDINQETVGQGLSNIVGGFFSCFVSCGSFNRSAANLEAGARTPLAGLLSALALAILVFFAAPLIKWLPLPVVAAVLFLVGASLVKPRDIGKLLATHGIKRWVFLLILLITVFSSVSDGLLLGVVASLVTYLRTVSRPDVEVLFEDEKAQYLPSGLAEVETTAISISGNLFFGSVQSLSKSFGDVASRDGRRAHLLIVGDYIQNIDTAAAEIIVQEARNRRQHGFKTLLRLRHSAFDHTRGGMALEEGLGSDNIILTDGKKND